MQLSTDKTLPAGRGGHAFFLQSAVKLMKKYFRLSGVFALFLCVADSVFAEESVAWDLFSETGTLPLISDAS
ncbi:MAG: hypothetical protein IJF68_04665, partial [Opitutales bacterium]|nr:hypothetical protein [Opitutales bacterium]